MRRPAHAISRLRSLLDVLNFYASRFISIFDSLNELSNTTIFPDEKSSWATDFPTEMDRLIVNCDALGWKEVSKQADRLKAWAIHEDTTAQTLQALLTELKTTLAQEIHR